MSRTVDADAQSEELLACYSHAIDNDALETWPDFFLSDGQYLVTTRENHVKGWPGSCIATARA
jgi:anthranilate 1,2-dioxygenase small subunit